MARNLFILMVAIVLGAGASLAMAQTRSAYIVTRHGTFDSLGQPISVHDHNASSAAIVQAPVVRPAVVPSPELADQPVWPHLLEIRITAANARGQRPSTPLTTIWLDPDRNYYSQDGVSHLDDNHSILKMQRLGRSMRNPGAYIVRSPLLPRFIYPSFTISPIAVPDDGEPQLLPMPVPRFMLPKPLTPAPPAPPAPLMASRSE
ncbi:MAG: hypothetical protein IT440_15070 [Phycisphaeraceae bacterium]|nr:hypothetical protein [Phycisphaeraceae bacterium]